MTCFPGAAGRSAKSENVPTPSAPPAPPALHMPSRPVSPFLPQCAVRRCHLTRRPPRAASSHPALRVVQANDNPKSKQSAHSAPPSRPQGQHLEALRCLSDLRSWKAERLAKLTLRVGRLACGNGAQDPGQQPRIHGLVDAARAAGLRASSTSPTLSVLRQAPRGADLHRLPATIPRPPPVSTSIKQMCRAATRARGRLTRRSCERLRRRAAAARLDR
jgi:hypothetical protein